MEPTERRGGSVLRDVAVSVMEAGAERAHLEHYSYTSRHRGGTGATGRGGGGGMVPPGQMENINSITCLRNISGHSAHLNQGSNLYQYAKYIISSQKSHNSSVDTLPT